MTDRDECRLRIRAEDIRASDPDTADLLTEAADEIDRLRAALEIIAGRRQCVDNLMSNVDVACAALNGYEESKQANHE